MSYAGRNSAAAQDWASQKREKEERAKRIREQRKAEMEQREANKAVNPRAGGGGGARPPPGPPPAQQPMANDSYGGGGGYSGGGSSHGGSPVTSSMGALDRSLSKDELKAMLSAERAKNADLQSQLVDLRQQAYVRAPPLRHHPRSLAAPGCVSTRPAGPETPSGNLLLCEEGWR